GPAGPCGTRAPWAEALPCAPLSRALEEPLHGTASVVRGWVLLEQPGPWGVEAGTESRPGRELARALPRLRAHGGPPRARRVSRPRGPGGEGRGGRQPSACFVAHTSRLDRWLERRRL